MKKEKKILKNIRVRRPYCTMTLPMTRKTILLNMKISSISIFVLQQLNILSNIIVSDSRGFSVILITYLTVLRSNQKVINQLFPK